MTGLLLRCCKEFPKHLAFQDAFDFSRCILLVVNQVSLIPSYSCEHFLAASLKVVSSYRDSSFSLVRKFFLRCKKTNEKNFFKRLFSILEPRKETAEFKR